MASKRGLNGTALAAFAFGGAFLLPLVVNDSYVHDLLIQTMLFAYLGLSWNILSGFAGQFSLGHATFYGLGGYTSTLLFMKAGVTPWVGMIAGGLIALLVGVAVGYLTFRYGIRGVHFTLITYALSGMFQVVAVNWKWVGGAMGLMVNLKGNAPELFQFESKVPYYYTMLLLLLGVALLSYWISRSRLGLYFTAVRDQEGSAAALGIRPMQIKLGAMAISAFLTALGGTFYAQYQFYIDPHLMFGGGTSIQIFMAAVIGGAGTTGGPLVGSVFLTGISEISKVIFRGRPGLDLALYGLIMVVIVLFLPDGIISLRQRFGRRPGAARKEAA